MESKEDPVMYVCDVCGKGIANKCNLKRHKLMHSGYSESVRCEVCQKVLSSEGNLKRHMRMHMGIQDRQECSVCHKTFSNVGNLRRHTRIHQTNAEQFECKLCKKCFPYEDYLKKHIKTVHSAEVKSEAAESSSLPHIESFIKREEGPEESRRSDSELLCANIATPEAKKTTEEEEEEEADDDESSSSQQSTSKEAGGSSRHLSLANGEAEPEGPGSELREKLCPPEECNICRLVLTDPAQVKLSVWRMHLDMRSMKKQGSTENVSFEFNCTVCGKFLSNKGNLKRHMLLLHKKDLIGSDVDVTTEQMRAQCEICGRIVANKGNLKRHMEKVHVIKRVGGEESESGGEATSNGSPPAKKRRSKKVSGDAEGQAKGGLKIRIKNAQAGLEERRQFGEPAAASGQKPEPEKERQEGVNNGVPDVDVDEDDDDEEDKPAEGGHRWRSRSFDEAFPGGQQGGPAPSNELGECYSCPMCQRRFVCEENYKKHMKRHRSYKPTKILDPNAVAEQQQPQPQQQQQQQPPQQQQQPQPQQQQSQQQQPPQQPQQQPPQQQPQPQPQPQQPPPQPQPQPPPPPPPPHPVMEQQAMCNICGIQMPFGAALHHHLTTVHRDIGDAPPELTASTACSSTLQNDIVNWSYPPILTRFMRRDEGLRDPTYPAYPDPPRPVLPAHMYHPTSRPPAFSAPPSPLRKFILDARSSGGATPHGPADSEPQAPPPQTADRREPPVLVIMQPRCA